VYKTSLTSVIFSVGLALLASAAGLCVIAIPFLFKSLWPQIILGFYSWPLGACLALTGLMLGLQAISAVGWRVEVHPEGIARHRFGRLRSYHWNQMRTVQNHNDHARHGGKTYRWCSNYSVDFEDGKRMLFGGIFVPSLPGTEALGRTIEEATLPHLIAKAREAYSAGEELDFGRLKLSARGLAKRHAVLLGGPVNISFDWNEIKEIFFDRDGWFTVERKDKGWAICLSPGKLSNIHVLITLLDELKKLPGAGWVCRLSLPAGRPSPAVLEV
jgi:hypothetical protein